MSHHDQHVEYRSRFIGRVNQIEAYPSYTPNIKGVRVSLSATDTDFGGYATITVPLGESVPELGTICVMTIEWSNETQQEPDTDADDDTVVEFSTDT